jgi:hypothetical protein
MRHRMIVLNRDGDFSVEWDPKLQSEIERATAEFESLRKRGYVAFPFTGGARLDFFDARQKEIVMVPRLVGG